MSSDIEAWPPPDDPAAFESLCLDLWKEIWGPDSHSQPNGRRGQPQAGVDVFGTDREGRQVGVQCKQKSGLLRSKLAVRELEIEVGNARTFLPSLSLFIVATTGPRDEAVQERARLFTEEGFAVEVWSWPDLWHEIYGRKEFHDRIGPIYWPRLFGQQRGQRILLERLPKVSGVLVGREERLQQLDEAWNDPATLVVTVVAWGGVGKTALLAEWEGRLAARGFDGADAFDWSFYSQGTKENLSVSGETFLNAALVFFGGEKGEEIAKSAKAGAEKGKALAEFIARREALLVLDGLEPLQYPPSSPLHGEIKDPGVALLLKTLALKNSGLCVVTTREEVKDLARYRNTTAPEWKLERLSTAAGVDLLGKLKVKGRKQEKEGVVEKVKGHALTLNLLGTYLRDAFEGDIRQVDLVDFGEADREEQGGHAFRVIAAYERWLIGEGKDEASRELAVLRLLGLFDRPADKGCLAALRKEPSIPDLTEPIVGLSDRQWNLVVSRLAARGLVSSDGGALDAHPLLREYFGDKLKKEKREAWRAAHGRLFEHLRDTTPRQPDTLEGLQPLYQAIAHGCHAGRQQEACDGIYWDRILRGTESAGFYSTTKLGAFGTDLGAVACFFDTPWSLVSPDLSEAAQAWLLNQAAVRLLALGRLTEARQPMQAGLARAIDGGWLKDASISASSLSELKLTMGEIAQSGEDAAHSVTLADQSGDAFRKISNRTNYADALHQAGRRHQSRALFAEAEAMQAEMQPEYPRLYSLRGFRYCDLLLAEAERAAGRRGGAVAAGAEFFEAIREVEERASEALGWAEKNRVSLLDIASSHLTLGRATLYRSILERSGSAVARAEIEAALDGLRRAGTTHHVPKALLTRAWLHSAEGNSKAARADLDEAQEIAERGPMPLFLADIALYRGRLFGDRAALAEARRLIDKHGYGRRLGELEDAEAALASASAASS